MSRTCGWGETDREARGPADVLAGVEEAQVHAVLAGQLFDDLAVLIEFLEASGRDCDEPGVRDLGKAGNELLLPVEQRLGGSTVSGIDAPALVLLGCSVRLQFHEVTLDAAATLMGRYGDQHDSHGPSDSTSGEKRLHPRWWLREPRPGADPPGAMERSVCSQIAPFGVCRHRAGGARSYQGEAFGQSTHTGHVRWRDRVDAFAQCALDAAGVERCVGNQAR
jgi:hypothetical protein